MTCTQCEATLPPGIHLCAGCVIRLEATLDQIPDALEAAAETAAKQDVLGSAGATGGTSSDPAMPINMTASERRTELWEIVVSWARWVIAEDQRAEQMPSEPTAYLRASTGEIRLHDWAGDLAAELHEKHAAVMRAVDLPPDIVSLGQCGAEEDGVRCAGTIRGQRGAQAAQCRECGAAYDAPAVQQERIAAAWHVHDTLSRVVRALQLSGYDVKLKSAQRWASSGALASDGKRPDGIAVYTPADVLEVASRMRAGHGGQRAA